MGAIGAHLIVSENYSSIIAAMWTQYSITLKRPNLLIKLQIRSVRRVYKRPRGVWVKERSNVDGGKLNDLETFRPDH